jgi:putative glutathione S-transferase
MVEKSLEEEQTDIAARRAKGDFVRGVSGFRSVIGKDPDFPAEPGRYHLFVALNCPWCHRVTLARNILGLRESITMDVAFPSRTSDDDPVEPNRWEFNPNRIATFSGTTLPECTGETATGKNYRLAKHIYEAEGSTEASVPILYDKKAKRIVANESAEIIRMLNVQSQALGSTITRDDRPNLYPEGDEHSQLRQDIDTMNEEIYVTINNGAYKAGFSSDQTVMSRKPHKYRVLRPLSTRMSTMESSSAAARVNSAAPGASM